MCRNSALAFVYGEGIFRVEQVVSLRRPDAQRDGILKHGENLQVGAPYQLWPLPHVKLITCTHGKLHTYGLSFRRSSLAGTEIWVHMTM